MLILDKNGYTSKGNNRLLFLLDDFPGKCLKVSTIERMKKLRKESAHWYKKFRPYSCFSENLKDIRGYKVVDKKLANDVYNYIPNYYGIIKTNLGDGILVDYIENAISIREYLKRNGLTNELKIELGKLFETLYKNNIQVRDLNLSNFIIKTDDDKKLTLKLIDGLGNSQLIPLAEWFDSIGKRQIKKRFGYFINYICSDFDNLKKEAIEFKEYVLKNILF